MPEQGAPKAPVCGGKGTKKDKGCSGPLLALVPNNNRKAASEWFCVACWRSYPMMVDHIKFAFELGLVKFAQEQV